MFRKLASLGWKLWVALAVFLVLGWWGISKLRSEPQYQWVKAERRDVVETVSVTGMVKPGSTIKMEFLSSGRVVSRPYTIGARVSRGASLMALDVRELDIQIIKAEAALSGSRAKLEQLKSGATPETVRQAQNAVDSEYRKTSASLDAAITKADNLLAVLRADVFSNINTVRTDFQLPQDSTTARAEREMADAAKSLMELSSMRAGIFVSLDSDLEELFYQASQKLEIIKQAGVTSSDLLRKVTSSVVTQATINGYLDDIAAARAGLDTAQSSFASGISALQAAKDAYFVKTEPPRQVDIDVFEASVSSSEADLALLKKQRSDLALYAPVDGIITGFGFELGENAKPGAAAVSMISAGGLEIEANMPEVDISKVALSNPVKITIDALPGESFSGSVTHIDPAETVVEGVTNYKIKVAFDAADPRVKSGTTANLVVETLRKPNVLALPQVGIIEKDEGTFVKKLVNGKTEEIPAKTGIRSSDGYVEVISGVSEGEEVLNAGIKTAK